MVTLKTAIKRYVQGYTKTAVFALTTQCNCKCIMCDMHKKKPEYIRLQDAQKVLKLMDALENQDDVQNLYSNFDIPEEVLAQLEA